MDKKLISLLKFQRAMAATGLERPLILFIVSAGASVWLAYDRIPALISFGRILLAAGLFFLVVNLPRRLQAYAAWIFLCLTAAFSVFWALRNNYAAGPDEFDWITSIGVRLNATFPLSAGPALHPNVAAGTMLAGLPFGIVLGWGAYKQAQTGLVILASGTSALILAGLLLADSRGVWVGLGATVLLAGLAAVQRRWFSVRRARRRFWGVALALALLLAAALVWSGLLETLAGQIPDPGGLMRSRTALWREGAGLARDYFFTGAGLASFSLNHAAYAILTHVPYTANSHNAFLEIWIEQGILGAAALLWGLVVTLGWARQALSRRAIPRLAWAGLAGLWAAGVHGVVEVAFYGQPTLPVIGVVLGFAALAAPNPADRPAKLPLASRRAALLIGAAVLASTALVFHRPIRAGWYVNLGALEQSRIELSQFDPENFDHPALEEIRARSDLQHAQSLFRKALSIQPDNLTALRRLSLIALAQGEYPAALAWMETAWNAGWRETTTRLIYGDALVAAGQPDLAANVLQGISWAAGRLAGQGWARYWNQGDAARAVYAWQAALELDPQNRDAAVWLANANSHGKP
ncbi:MAG: O-antigen ligase family protein [Anaerolineae bacterium]|nr:O-antigen ligase family protein [Anaerolineae bacterium]MCZ7553179.1 O-antigen ligase family protein [Anaerolineales bacterium]